MPHHPQPWNAAQTIFIPPPLVTATTASPSTIVSWTELRPPRTTPLLLSLHHRGRVFAQPNKSNRCRHLLLSFKIVCLFIFLSSPSTDYQFLFGVNCKCSRADKNSNVMPYIFKVYVTAVMVPETALILPNNAEAKILGDVLNGYNIEWIYQDLVHRP
ncbi:uncharacterized protein LOC127250641 [Andrographis paniculata]|uniref:uncharacterized protein LOC127250641 n=1 Tax=Andrographis paniculata TaxID=175694 RepID=UPI0021E76C6A|nr:uncharacterized protein LOC127250641 [Andrographis paniculata]